MTLSLLAPDELPALREFFARLPLEIPPENLAQFCAPRLLEGGLEVATLVMKEHGSIVGTVGWIDVPLRQNDDLGVARHSKVRWPVNLYLLSDQRGKGLGRRLMEATREGATLRAVIGGNSLSIPVLEKTGFRPVATLVRARWTRPCLAPSMLADRLGGEARRLPRHPRGLLAGAAWRFRSSMVRARPTSAFTGVLPWSEESGRGAPGETGVPRDAAYLQFAFGGEMAPYHARYLVDVNGALSGYFILAARRGQRFRLAAEIVDLDTVPGREPEVLEAARRTGLACADVVSLRIAGGRFTGALAGMTRGTMDDHALRISCEEPGAVPQGGWRLSYGDHDQYRVRAASLKWRPG